MAFQERVLLRGVDVCKCLSEFRSHVFTGVPKTSGISKQLIQSKSDVKRDMINGVPYKCVSNRVISDTENYNCMYCLRSVPGSQAIGIPLSCRKNTYFTVDIFCQHECQYAEACLRARLFKEYSESPRLCREMYSKTFPGKELKEAPDRRLLQVFNGDLTHEQFHASSGLFCNRNQRVYDTQQVREYVQEMYD